MYRMIPPMMLTAVCSMPLFGCVQVIPDGDGLEDVPVFEGAPAKPRPLRPKNVIPHPFLGETSVFHEDHYNSDVQNFPSPLGIDPKVLSRFYVICSPPLLNSQGQIITICLNPGQLQGGTGQILYLLDPDTLEVLAALPQQFVPPTVGSVGGGAYPHVTNDDKLINGSISQTIDQFEVVEDNGELAWQKTVLHDVSSHLSENENLFEAVPDFDGNLWFTTALGRVGFIDAWSGDISTIQLGDPSDPDAIELVENGAAVGEDGVFVLTSRALYRMEFDEASGQPVVSWRETYEVDPNMKPGLFSIGAGTTPTLLGRDLISIVDNAVDQVNLLVYKRNAHIEGDRTICKVPLFDPGASAADVSPIGYSNGRRNSLVVANWFGAPDVISLPNGSQLNGFIGSYRTLAPGLTRIDVRRDYSGCDVRWDRDDIASTTIPKLATTTGLLYTWTQKIDETTESVFPPIDAWYLTAVDFKTGERVWDLLVGTGPYYHNAFLGPALHPNGSIYHTLLGGIVKVGDAASADTVQYWVNYFKMLFSKRFRKLQAERSKDYSIESTRVEEPVRTNCNSNTTFSAPNSLLVELLGRQQGAPPGTTCDMGIRTPPLMP